MCVRNEDSCVLMHTAVFFTYMYSSVHNYIICTLISDRYITHINYQLKNDVKMTLRKLYCSTSSTSSTLEYLYIYAYYIHHTCTCVYIYL